MDRLNLLLVGVLVGAGAIIVWAAMNKGDAILKIIGM